MYSPQHARSPSQRLPPALLPQPRQQQAHRLVRRQLRQPHPPHARDRRAHPRLHPRQHAPLPTDLRDGLARGGERHGELEGRRHGETCGGLGGYGSGSAGREQRGTAPEAEGQIRSGYVHVGVQKLHQPFLFFKKKKQSKKKRKKRRKTPSLTHTSTGYQAPFAKAVKAKLRDRLAVGTVGTITSGKQAQQLLDDEDRGLDLAIVGRMFQKNPGLVWTFAEELGVQVNVANQIRWGFGGRPGAAKKKEGKM